MSSLSELQAYRAEIEKELDTVKKLLPGDKEVQDIHAGLLDSLAIVDREIAEKHGGKTDVVAAPAQAAAAALSTASSIPPASSAPPTTSSAPPTTVREDTSRTFKVNDKVSAKWHGDKQFYPARIVSVTGSRADPVYTVIFDGYKETETLRGHLLRDLNGKKRSADAVAPPSPPPSALPSSKPTGVISAAANVNPALIAEARKETGKASGDGPRPAKVSKKLNDTKTLDRKKGDWQSFSNRRMRGMRGMKSNGIFRSASERTQPGAPDARPASRVDASRFRPLFDGQNGSKADR